MSDLIDVNDEIVMCKTCNKRIIDNVIMDNECLSCKIERREEMKKERNLRHKDSSYCIECKKEKPFDAFTNSYYICDLCIKKIYTEDDIKFLYQLYNKRIKREHILV